MTVKTNRKAEYGDFQTPIALAQQVCSLLAEHGVRPAAILEPTCGLGNFLWAGLDHFRSIKKVVGVDINTEYIRKVKAGLRERADAAEVDVIQGDFFATNWPDIIAALPEPILVLGNLPWVTNAHLGSLGSGNLPLKSNFQNRNGLDAITGKANFDISEWMLIRLLETMNGRRGTLAMLCKSSVARKILSYAWTEGIATERCAIYGIEADLHFGASVDAALLTVHLQPGAHTHEATVHPRLKTRESLAVIALEDGMLFADVVAYRKLKHLCGQGDLKWRSGVKHDCSRVMELTREGGRYRNGLKELVELETEYLYPMAKSSDVANGRREVGSRWMIVTQTTVGEDTGGMERNAPRTWRYLQSHADLLNNRGSSIYRDRPAFSIFGIGTYSFAPWKVAISGFYKKLEFRAIGPCSGKPVMLDDTSYFLPCQSEEPARYLAILLNSPAAQAFYRAFVFWDAKRPITVDLLRRLDLRKLALDSGESEKYDKLVGRPEPCDRKPSRPKPKAGRQVLTPGLSPDWL